MAVYAQYCFKAPTGQYTLKQCLIGVVNLAASKTVETLANHVWDEIKGLDVAYKIVSVTTDNEPTALAMGRLVSFKVQEDCAARERMWVLGDLNHGRPIVQGCGVHDMSLIAKAIAFPPKSVEVEEESVRAEHAAHVPAHSTNPIWKDNDFEASPETGGDLTGDGTEGEFVYCGYVFCLMNH